MVRLILVLCALHGSACRQVDPMLAAMPLLTCETRGTLIFSVWAEKNPELLARRRLGRIECVAPAAIGQQL